MRHLISLLVLSTSAYAAAPTIASVTVDAVDYSGARLTLRTTAPITDPLFTVTWGYSHNEDNFTWGGSAIYCTNVDSNDDDVNDRADCSLQITPVLPGVRVYVHPRVKEGAAENTTWACSGGSITQGTITGLTCQSGEVLPYFTSSAVPGPWDVSYPSGTFPQQPTLPSYTYPNITAVVNTNTFNVASNCSDFSTKIASAVTAAATQDVQVMLPYGPANPCPGFTLPNYAGAHRIVIRSSAPDYNLPAPNGRAEARHLPYMSYINPTGYGAAVVGSSTTKGYILMGLMLTTANLYPTTDIDALTITQSEQGTSLSGTTWKFTVSGTLPSYITAGSRIALDGVASYNSACGPGLKAINAVLGSNSFQLYCDGEDVVPSTPNTSGGRTVVPVGAQRITDVTPGVCASGNARVRLATNSRWGLGDNTVIHIAGGSGIAGLGGRGWRITSASGRDACLVSSSGLSGTYVANSAFFAVDTPVTNIVDIADSQQIWLDRVIVEGNGFPNRTYAGVGLTGCNNCGVVNSSLLNLGVWLSIDPATGGYAVYSVGLNIATGLAIEMTGVDGLRIQNNKIQGSGILLFGQANNADLGRPVAVNIGILNNEIEAPLSRIAGQAGSDGLYWAHRHLIEFKMGQRILIQGNIMIGTWADDVTAAPAIALTVRQQIRATLSGHTLPSYVDALVKPGRINDITIRDNIFIAMAGVLNISYDSDSNRYGTLPVRRIAFLNNIIHDINFYNYRSDPSAAAAGAGFPTSVTSGSMIHMGMSHGMTMDHNTYVRQKGQGPAMVEMSTWPFPLPHWRITNNIYEDTRTGLGASWFLGSFITWGGTMKDTWSSIGARVGTSETFEGDPYSLFAGNLIVPGSQNNDEYAAWNYGCYTSTSTACNWSNAESQGFWGTGSNTAGTFKAVPYNFTGTTPDARLAEVGFQNWQGVDYHIKQTAVSGVYSPASAASGYSADGQDIGVNQDLLDQGVYFLKNVRVNTVRTTSAVISFTAPQPSENCYVTCPNCATTRYTDNTASRVRNVSITGLTTGTAYNAAVACGNKEQLINFRTQ